MGLEQYTTEDLKAELRRRRYQKNGDWYFFYEDEDEEPDWRSDLPNFIFIHKRMYHLQHKVQETNISSFLKLPKYFSEHRASNFEYHGGRHGERNPEKKAKKKLQEYGFIELKKPLLGDECVLMHNFNVADKKRGFGIEWHVEREDLKVMLNDFLINHPWEDEDTVKLVDYINECHAFASVHGCVAYFYNIKECYMDAAFLPSDIFHSLPKNLFNRQEGHE